MTIVAISHLLQTLVYWSIYFVNATPCHINSLPSPSKAISENLSRKWDDPHNLINAYSEHSVERVSNFL